MARVILYKHYYADIVLALASHPSLVEPNPNYPTPENWANNAVANPSELGKNWEDPTRKSTQAIIEGFKIM